MGAVVSSPAKHFSSHPRRDNVGTCHGCHRALSACDRQLSATASKKPGDAWAFPPAPLPGPEDSLVPARGVPVASRCQHLPRLTMNPASLSLGLSCVEDRSSPFTSCRQAAAVALGRPAALRAVQLAKSLGTVMAQELLGVPGVIISTWVFIACYASVHQHPCLVQDRVALEDGGGSFKTASS